MAEASHARERAAALIGEARPAEARTLLLAALAASPEDAQLHYLLGAAEHAAGAPAAALASFNRAATLDPTLLAARQGRAAMLLALGHADAALAESAALVVRFPDDAQNLANHALLRLQIRGDAAAALALWDRALALAPGLAPALSNRGTLLLQLGRTTAAVANAHGFVDAHPADPRAHAQLGEALLADGEPEAALAAIDRALALGPGSALLHVKRGYALAALRRFGPAREAFDTARSLDPAAVDEFRGKLAPGRVAPELDPEAIYLARAYERQLRCDWSDRDTFLEVFRRSLARREGPPTERGLLFPSLSLPLSPDERLTLARAVSAHVASGVQAADREGHPGSGRLRVGYVSPDFRDHLIARLTHRLLAAHDRRGFEIFAYALCPADGTGLRAAVEQAADVFRDVSGVDDRAAAAVIARDRLDLLVDLGGYTLGSRTEILAMRPAPVQASWLGYTSTMGADFIDYAFVDHTIAPSADDWHEQPVYLPGTFFVYPPTPEDVPAADRRECGLPGDALVLCAFHHPRKIDPAAVDAWMAVLRAVPGSVLWLIDAEVDYVPHLRREAAARGVAAGRLLCAPRESHDRYLGRLALADLFLDAFLYNAATTACDAIWMGVPVVTLAGNTPTSRAAASILGASELSDLVAATPDAYVALAVRLARDASARRAVQERVRASRVASPIFDVAGRARALETAFRAMVARSRRGLPPSSIDVAPGPGPERSAP